MYVECMFIRMYVCDMYYFKGKYSCLSVDLEFKRQISYYIVTIYVPTFMIVCVSWMSFWLDHKSAPARVSLTGQSLYAHMYICTC